MLLKSIRVIVVAIREPEDGDVFIVMSKDLRLVRLPTFLQHV